MTHQKLLALEHDLVLDPEFRALCPRQSADESAQLERSLLADGCRDDLVACKATREILDGYNRHPLCERHPIRFGVVLLELADRDDCKRWILANQFARRNMSQLAASYFRGTRYLLEKGPHGGNHSNGQATSHVETLELSARLADEYQVSRATIFRDATFAAAVDSIAASCGHEAKQVILARDTLITRHGVLLLARLDAEARQQALEELIENGRIGRRAGRKTATITLPAEPKALAEKLIERLGAEASLQVAARIRTLARTNTVARSKERGARSSERGTLTNREFASSSRSEEHETRASILTRGASKADVGASILTRGASKADVGASILTRSASKADGV